SLLVVTADHGQSNTWERVPIGKVLRESGFKVNVVADGSFASIFLEDESDRQEVIDFLNDLDCIDGLWYKNTFDKVGIGTPYTGDIA
ncbi:MAG: hypothetical protein GWN64_13115, partial [Candidatus Thorarchaeota archaeon]|nr:hypothetical protein [Candidatus Thorarchaeota archaeon]